MSEYVEDRCPAEGGLGRCHLVPGHVGPHSVTLTWERMKEAADAPLGPPLSFRARAGFFGEESEARCCHACDQVRTDVGELPDTLPLCTQCAKAHRMGYRCGEEAAALEARTDYSRTEGWGVVLLGDTFIAAGPGRKTIEEARKDLPETLREAPTIIGSREGDGPVRGGGTTAETAAALPRSSEARCPWSHRIGYDCELPEGHAGDHAATDLDGKSKVGWKPGRVGEYRRERPRPDNPSPEDGYATADDVRRGATATIETMYAEIHRLRNVIRTGGAMYRAERACLGIPGGYDPEQHADYAEPGRGSEPEPVGDAFEVAEKLVVGWKRSGDGLDGLVSAIAGLLHGPEKDPKNAAEPMEIRCIDCGEPAPIYRCIMCGDKEMHEVAKVVNESCAKVCERWAADNREAFREQSLAAESCAGAIRRLALDEKGTAGR